VKNRDDATRLDIGRTCALKATDEMSWLCTRERPYILPRAKNFEERIWQKECIVSEQISSEASF
jgi:hypothetical protein